MDHEEAFINFYRHFYFDNTVDNELKKDLGIPTLNTTNRDAEGWIIREKLNCGVFDKFSLAWKAGKVTDYDSDNDTVNTNEFEIDNNYYNGWGKPINIDDFDDFCNFLNNFEFNTNDLSNTYSAIQDAAPTNIGPVYIITSMFFKTRGKYPIYDQFAHKAVRSLKMDIVPDKVYMGNNPDKKEKSKVLLMYNEYKSLLSSLFPNYTNELQEPFIPRKLDQALWVYGHCKRSWDEIKDQENTKNLLEIIEQNN